MYKKKWVKEIEYWDHRKDYSMGGKGITVKLEKSVCIRGCFEEAVNISLNEGGY